MCNQKFFKCNHCGKIIGLIKTVDVPTVCCGDSMEELIPNTVEASTEKHIPEVSANGRLIHAKVGSVAHPMTEEHHIEFIYLQGQNGGQRKCLKIGAEAEAMFAIVDDTPLEVFAYCNLHGLWKTHEICDCGCGKTTADCGAQATEEPTCSAEFSEGCK